MRQLRSDVDAAVAEGRNRPLPLQRLRPLLQDERPEPTSHQTQTTTRKSNLINLKKFGFFMLGYFFELRDLQSNGPSVKMTNFPFNFGHFLKK